MADSSATKPVVRRFDVAILGDHLATALLAAILGRRGVRTVLVPTESDDGWPAGETTVPYTAELFFLLGGKFGLPEVTAMGMFDTLPDALRGACGVKRNLGFLYHRPGTTQQPAEALQFNVPAEHAEWHVFRPEAEAYASGLAAAKGATVLGVHARPGGVRVSADGVDIALSDGSEVSAEYLVNGGADPLMLPGGVHRPAPERAMHRSRLLFTHLIGVRPFESVTPLRLYQKASPWSKGSLLHVFQGGWVQVVPFGNHDRSINSLSSVAISLDPAQIPPADTPASDFLQVLQRIPDIGRQFDGALPINRWRRFDSWPAIAAECAGPRWMLFDRAAGRHDLLLSRDLTMSLELVHAAATGLLRMAASGDWAGDGMKEVADFQVGLFDFHDRFVAAGRIAAGDFALWNAYLRVWLLWSILSALSLKRARLDSGRTPGQEGWPEVERFDQFQHWYQVPAGLPGLLLEALRDIENVPLGASAAGTADRIFAKLRSERFIPPLYRFGDPDARYYNFTRARRLRTLLWTKTTAPADFRRLLTADNVTAVPRNQGEPVCQELPAGYRANTISRSRRQ